MRVRIDRMGVEAYRLFVKGFEICGRRGEVVVCIYMNTYTPKMFMALESLVIRVCLNIPRIHHPEQSNICVCLAASLA